MPFLLLHSYNPNSNDPVPLQIAWPVVLQRPFARVLDPDFNSLSSC